MQYATTFRRGDIVTVPFPCTNLQATKVRPVLVVSVDAYLLSAGDLVLAQITSAENLRPHLGDCHLSDWRAAGLRAPSVVRAKVFTLHRSLVRRSVGTATAADMRAVEAALRMILGL
ncbi:MAG: type II toxin-antitoxin system PemK/MazF family toxin [Dehalococcoidia bacterium]|nr:type II toxin-antitoxin system PemK/MazF family toxin [Dehalococcoidia bacterium]